MTDLSGKKIGKLTVISPVRIRDKKGRSRVWWNCHCDCGKDCLIRASALTRTKERQKSCGCMLASFGGTKHGLYHTRLHKTWSNMKTRCFNPNCKRYMDYGGRGITVCDEWKNDFLVFYKWAINNGYSDELTLDRINNDGNYEPSNCRWAEPFTQRINRRDVHLITYNGETLTAKEWSKRIGGNEHLVSYRLRAGWDEIKAITTPPTKRRKFYG